MVNEKLQEILEFAIKSEKDAVAYYAYLQAKAKDKEVKQLFAELIAMEKNHAKLLESIDLSQIEKFEVPKIVDLGISDNMKEVEDLEGLTYQDAIVLAMKREKDAREMYLRLADQCESESARNLFLKLASEEAKHKLMLESLYDEEILYDN